MTETVGWLQ